MKDVLKSALVTAFLLQATAAQAGGPVIIEEGNDELIEENTVRSAGILPVLGMILVLGLIAGSGGGGGGGTVPDPDPEPEK